MTRTKRHSSALGLYTTPQGLPQKKVRVIRAVSLTLIYAASLKQSPLKAGIQLPNYFPSRSPMRRHPGPKVPVRPAKTPIRRNTGLTQGERQGNHIRSPKNDKKRVRGSSGKPSENTWGSNVADHRGLQRSQEDQLMLVRDVVVVLAQHEGIFNFKSRCDFTRFVSNKLAWMNCTKQFINLVAEHMGYGPCSKTTRVHGPPRLDVRASIHQKRMERLTNISTLHFVPTAVLARTAWENSHRVLFERIARNPSRFTEGRQAQPEMVGNAESSKQDLGGSTPSLSESDSEEIEITHERWTEQTIQRLLAMASGENTWRKPLCRRGALFRYTSDIECPCQECVDFDKYKESQRKSNVQDTDSKNAPPNDDPTDPSGTGSVPPRDYPPRGADAVAGEVLIPEIPVQDSFPVVRPSIRRIQLVPHAQTALRAGFINSCISFAGCALRLGFRTLRAVRLLWGGIRFDDPNVLTQFARLSVERQNSFIVLREQCVRSPHYAFVLYVYANFINEGRRPTTLDGFSTTIVQSLYLFNLTPDMRDVEIVRGLIPYFWGSEMRTYCEDFIQCTGTSGLNTIGFFANTVGLRQSLREMNRAIIDLIISLPVINVAYQVITGVSNTAIQLVSVVNEASLISISSEGFVNTIGYAETVGLTQRWVQVYRVLGALGQMTNLIYLNRSEAERSARREARVWTLGLLRTQEVVEDRVRFTELPSDFQDELVQESLNEPPPKE